jgi:hypothetical protein
VTPDEVRQRFRAVVARADAALAAPVAVAPEPLRPGRLHVRLTCRKRPRKADVEQPPTLHDDELDERLDSGLVLGPTASGRVWTDDEEEAT